MAIFLKETDKPLSTFLLFSLLIVFFVLSIIGILNHELWLDEMHHWLLGKDSGSLVDLWKNTRYEGHPILWNLFLYGISRFTNNPFWMQLLHISISTMAVFLFLKFSPFSKIFKTMFVFGYFPFYEYNILSRNYSVGILILFVCCTLYKERRSNYIILAILLSLAANTHLLSLMISMAFFFILLIDFFSNPLEDYNATVRRAVILSAIIFLGGLIISYVQIRVPADHAYKLNIGELLSIKRTAKTSLIFLKSLMPFPDVFSYNYWNTNIFISRSKVLAVLINITLLILPATLFAKKHLSLILFYSGSLVLLLFFNSFDRGAMRHFGFIYILFILSLWLSYYSQPTIILKKNQLKALLFINTRAKQTLVYGMLIVQLFAGIAVYTLDLLRPFSQAKQTVSFLKLNNLDDKFIVASSYNALPPLSGYLGKDIFSLEIKSYGSFCHWNVPFNKFTFNSKAIIARVIALKIEHPQEMILIINAKMDLQNDVVDIDLIKGFGGSVVRNESFYVYKVGSL